ASSACSCTRACRRRAAGARPGVRVSWSWSSSTAGPCGPAGKSWALRDTTLPGRLFRTREEAGLVLADAGCRLARARPDGGQRRLGDAHELGSALGRRLAVLHQLAVDVRVLAGVDALAGQETRVAGLGHRDAAQHLADDQLDVLVVDRDALVPVDLLDLVDQVLLRLPDALDVEQLLGVLGAVDDGAAGPDLGPVPHVLVQAAEV